jgi:hypothetical protein
MRRGLFRVQTAQRKVQSIAVPALGLEASRGAKSKTPSSKLKKNPNRQAPGPNR